MKPTLDTILQELYSIDGALQQNEKELIPLIKKMLELQPNGEPNAEFIEHVRMALREKNMQESTTSFLQTCTAFFSKHTPLQYTLTGVFLGFIMMTPLTYILNHSGFGPLFSLHGTQKLFSYSVENKGSNAFGTLSKNVGNAPVNEAKTMGSAEADRALSARPQSGGGGPNIMLAEPGFEMMPYPMTEYRFTFAGTLPILTDTVDVFKRVPSIGSVDVSTMLKSMQTGTIDLSSFKGAKTDMISFYQDTKYGYMGSISFKEGSVSINQNYEQWPHPENECRDEACYDRYRLKIQDIPSDDVLLKIAHDFVKEFGLDLAEYGSPEVDRQWQNQYAQATDKSIMTAPDTMRVVYPLIVDGKPVYEEGGIKVGMSIGVNIREKKVSDVYGIMNQQYQKSAYAGVTDEKSIRSSITNFGRYPMQEDRPDIQKTIIEVTLGDPELSLVRMYNYQAMQSEELLVPALVFPIVNIPSGASFYGTSITVPLAKELFDQRTSVNGLPTPMPMMEDAIKANQ